MRSVEGPKARVMRITTIICKGENVRLGIWVNTNDGVKLFDGRLGGEVEPAEGTAESVFIVPFGSPEGAGRALRSLAEEIEGDTSHFATCPQSHEWRSP